MLNKKNLFVILIGCTFLLSSFKISSGSTSHLQKPGLRTIVVDAGHGGEDGGADGSYSKEKDLTLKIALKLQQTLQLAMPDVNVVMTRTTDVFDNPRIKADKANNANGDLFISIHCDAADPIRHSEITGYKTQTYYTGKGKSRKKRTRKVPTYHYWSTPNPAKGASTYIWAVHKNDDKELAMRENESLYIDSTLGSQIGDFDPDSPEKRILYTLKTQQYFERSASLALTVEEEFENIGRAVRGALQRQVGIWVLQAVAMPSILVETGYITNPEEEDYLNSDKGQQETADAITQAVQRYRYTLENPNK
ncbi:N-acetylmuramoyl-L-alanine amidase [Panacibacter ginsenosidivorans]|uniref:N-acetylmuramoyl-L-alanine amidase n=1 Tax=Panacibacter ginsenosidivorans TaxID=1813871 RepID=A0A5B8VDE5_9BACT|nr:N-acetylmuramoyl-L-alanine amidase [Panacibacter ginsenosidivorans]QEC68991.1 N-acetylmuramoyl-L-alanine amidase [Panacibacter ginsenosidivorans]